jgi:site-specific DNA recombinase
MLESTPIRQRSTTEENEDRTLRAAVYARTSQTTRAHGYSLDAQVEKGVEHCQNLGWTVSFIYRDEAESGANTDRPMFQKMLEMAKRKAFDVIVFWKLDRFSRSLIHAVRLESELREHDVYLYSVTEQIDTTTATGRFNFRNLASAAEFERDMIKQRTQLGMESLAADAKWPNNSPPLGYTLTEENRLSIDDTEAELVTAIFEKYIELRSMPEVALALNEEGYQTQTGDEWRRDAVGDILSNDIYRGWYELGDVNKHVPEYQIIDDDTFQQVTEIRHRFQQDDASLPPMPASRKDAMIEDIREAYLNYLEA